MRRYLLIVLLVVAAFSSCDSFNLKQPAYLTFRWGFFNQDESVAVISSGYFFLDNFQFVGDREEGPPVEMEQTIPDYKISFTSGGSLGFSLDIPVGRYEGMQIELNPNDSYHPCMALMGEYYQGPEMIHFRIEWDQAKKLLFDPKTDQIVSKKKTYGVTLGVDTHLLLQSVDWGNLTTEVEGGETIAIISATKNVEAYNVVDAALQDALLMVIQQI